MWPPSATSRANRLKCLFGLAFAAVGLFLAIGGGAVGAASLATGVAGPQALLGVALAQSGLAAGLLGLWLCS